MTAFGTFYYINKEIAVENKLTLTSILVKSLRSRSCLIAYKHVVSS